MGLGFRVGPGYLHGRRWGVHDSRFSRLSVGVGVVNVDVDVDVDVDVGVRGGWGRG
jgi:hypothetical protein